VPYLPKIILCFNNQSLKIGTMWFGGVVKGCEGHGATRNDAKSTKYEGKQ
jgi:hypothetical protein